jgi:hypothetical protein
MGYELSWLERGHQELLFRTLAAEHNWLAASAPELPFPLLVAVGLDRAGRLVCTGLLATGLVVGAERSDLVEVTVRSLLRLRLAELVGQVAAGDTPTLRRALRMADDAGGLLRRKPGRKGYDQQHYEQIAEDVRGMPGATLHALASRWHVSEATARRWRDGARRLGLLDDQREEQR